MRAKEAYRGRAFALLRDFVASAEVASVPPPMPLREVPVPYKTCLARFDAEEYGMGYLKLDTGDWVELVDPPEAGDGWSYGQVVYPNGRKSEPGWFPPAFVR